MNTLEALKAGRDRIEQGWSQSAAFRSSDGAVTYIPDEAVAWCAYGAICIGHVGTPHNLAHRTLVNVIGEGGGLSIWNDDPSRTKEDVLAAYDKAIRLAEKGTMA
jgi:hypothetical protein